MRAEPGTRVRVGVVGDTMVAREGVGVWVRFEYGNIIPVSRRPISLLEGGFGVGVPRPGGAPYGRGGEVIGMSTCRVFNAEPVRPGGFELVPDRGDGRIGC